MEASHLFVFLFLFCSLTFSLYGFLQADSVKSEDEAFRLEFEWKKLQSPSIQSRSCHSASALATGPQRNKMFVFGGRTDHSLLNDLHAFDSDKGTWQQPKVFGNVPQPRNRHSSTAIGSKIFFFGGRGKNGFFSRGSFNDVHVFDTETMTWSFHDLKNGPAPRIAHTATAIHKTKILIFGGYDGSRTYFNDLFILHTDQMRWERVNAKGKPPKERMGHSATVLSDGNILIYGGQNDDIVLNDVYLLDVFDFSWRKQQTMGLTPPRVYGHSAFKIAFFLVIFGGSQQDEKQPYIYLLNLNQKNGSYLVQRALESSEIPKSSNDYISVNLGEVPPPTSYHTTHLQELSTRSFNLYLFGGYDGNHPSNDFYSAEIKLVPIYKVRRTAYLLLGLLTTFLLGILGCRYKLYGKKSLPTFTEIFVHSVDSAQIVHQTPRSFRIPFLGKPLKSFYFLCSGISLLVLFFFFLVTVDAFFAVLRSKDSLLMREKEEKKIEQAIAETLFNQECVWDNLSWFRKPIAYFRFTQDKNGHLIGDFKCVEYLKKINQDPALRVSEIEVCTKSVATALQIVMVKLSEGVAQCIEVFSQNLSFSTKMQLWAVFFPEAFFKFFTGLAQIGVNLFNTGISCFN